MGISDEMSPRVIKAISKRMIKPLSHTYNQPFLTGFIPGELKFRVLVTPVYNSIEKELF